MPDCDRPYLKIKLAYDMTPFSWASSNVENVPKSLKFFSYTMLQASKRNSAQPDWEIVPQDSMDTFVIFSYSEFHGKADLQTNIQNKRHKTLDKINRDGRGRAMLASTRECETLWETLGKVKWCGARLTKK